MRTRPEKRTGFTLIEVLTAMVVLSLAVLAVLGVLRHAQEAWLRSQRLSLAAELAAARMFEVERRGPGALTEVSGDFGPERPEWKWTLEETPAGFTGVRLLTVTVRDAGDPKSRFTLEKLSYGP